MEIKLLAISAAAIFTTAAGYFFFSSKRNKSILIKKHILSKESYKEVTFAIRKQFSAIYWPDFKKSRDERRKLQARSAEYEKYVSQFQKKIKDLIEEATKKVLKDFGISNSIFEDSVNYFDSDDDLREYGEKLVVPLPIENNQARLSREDTKKVLTVYSMRLRECDRGCPDLDEYLILNTQIEDEIYRTFRIEMEELNHAVEMYDDLEDLVEPLKSQTSYILASTDDTYE